jgi:hypothetical protein
VLTAEPISGCNDGNSRLNIVVHNTTDVDEWREAAKIYPNPTNGNVNIEAEGMAHVTVFNTMGQLVYDTDVDTDHLSINMQQFPAGSYIVRIVTANGVCSKRVNVIR